jgi:hypothetical protein
MDYVYSPRISSTPSLEDIGVQTMIRLKKKKREALRGKRRQSAITRYEKYSRMRYVSALNDVTRFYSPTLRKFIKMESEAENMWLGDVRLRLSTFSLHSIQL